jgi:TPR repeat protein
MRRRKGSAKRLTGLGLWVGVGAMRKLLPLVLVLFASQLFGELTPALVADIRKKAEAGDAKAQGLFGYWYASDQYDTGEGALKDDKEAVKWYRKAAMQGNARAQVALGGAYAKGEVVPKDYAAAYAWYSLAAGYPRSWRPDKDGRPESGTSGLAGKHLLPSLAKLMTPEQIAKGKELAKKLLKQIEANKKKKD